MTILSNVSAADLRRAADLKEQIERLQTQLNSCLSGGYVGSELSSAQIPTAVRKIRRAENGKTVSESVLQSMNSVNAMSIREILIAASNIRGKRISPGLLSVTLAHLKKAKKIASHARGQYRKR